MTEEDKKYTINFLIKGILALIVVATGLFDIAVDFLWASICAIFSGLFVAPSFGAIVFILIALWFLYLIMCENVTL